MSNAIVAIAGKNGGTLTPWQKGQSGNPNGRKTLGAYVNEWLNAFAFRKVNKSTLRRIIRAQIGDPNLKIAAVRYLRMMEHPDIADFEPVLDGQANLREMRAQGFDTATIKKVKSKQRAIPQGDNPPIIETEREIELHDRSGVEFDRVLDRTDGKSAQNVNVRGSIEHVRTIRVVGGDDPLLSGIDVEGGGGGVTALPGGRDTATGSGGDRQDDGSPIEVCASVRVSPESPCPDLSSNAGIVDGIGPSNP